jgi:hypothetical protein
MQFFLFLMPATEGVCCQLHTKNAVCLWTGFMVHVHWTGNWVAGVSVNMTCKKGLFRN